MKGPDTAGNFISSLLDLLSNKIRLKLSRLKQDKVTYRMMEK